MNSEKSVMQTTVSAESKMKAVGKKFRIAGLGNGLFSGLTYGIYSTLVMVASGYDPLVSAAGFLAAPFVSSGLNDLLLGSGYYFITQNMDD